MAILCLLFLTQLDPELPYTQKKNIYLFLITFLTILLTILPKENSSQFLTGVPFLKVSFR